MRTHPPRPTLVLVLACLLAILLFFLDIAVPQAHLWGSYLLPIVLAFLWGRGRDVYIVTAIASLLVVATFWTDGTAAPEDLVINHLLPLGILWAVAWLLAQRRQQQERLDKQVTAHAAQLDKIFRANPGAIAITRLSDGCFLDANPAYLQMLGYARDELVGRTSIDLGILSAVARAQIVDRVKRQAVAAPFAAQLRTKAGATIDIMTAIDTIDLAGEPCLLTMAADVTGAKRLEARAARMAAIVQSSNDAIISADLDGTLRSMNRAAEQLFGIQAAEAVGQHISLITPDLPEAERAAMFARLAAGEMFTLPDLTWTAPGGRSIDLSVTALPLMDNEGQMLGVASIARDITARKRLEDELQASVERWNMAAEISSIGVWDWRAGSDAVIWDERMYLLHGLAPGTTVTFAAWRALIHPDDRADVEEKSRKSGTERTRIPVEYRVVLPDGSLRYLLSIAGGLYNAAGTPVRQLGITMDITARKRMEANLRESEARFRSMFAGHAATMLLIDPATSAIVDANQAAADFYGYSLAELRAMHIWDLNTLPRAEIESRVQRARSRGLNVFDVPHRLADGTIREVELYASPIDTGSGELLFAIIADVTARRLAEEALRQSEQKWRSVFEFLPVGLSVVDNRNQVADSNPALAQILSMTPEGIRQGQYGQRRYFRADLSPMPPSEFPSVRAVDEGRIVRDEVIGVEKEDGELIWVSVSATPESIEGYALTVTADITAQKRAEQALRESEARYRLLVNNAEDVIWTVDLEGRFTFVNPAVEYQLGYRPEEVIGQRFDRWLTPASAAAAMERFAAAAMQVMAGKRPEIPQFEGEQIRKDGTQISTHTVAVPLLDEAGRPAAFQGITRNVTERQRLAAAVRESERKYRDLYDNSPDMYAVGHLWDETILDCNQTLARTLGYSRDELTGQPAASLFGPGTFEVLRANYPELLATGKSENFEAQLRCKDGTLLDALVSGTVEPDPIGGPSLVRVTFRNITARKRAEAALAASEAQLREAYQRVQLAADAAGLGIWNWNVADNSLDWDDRMCELYGVTAEERRQGIFYDLWRARVHPDDLVLADLAQGDPTHVGGAWSGSYRIVLPGGAVRHIQANSITEYDHDGKGHRVIGVNRDITDQILYEQLLQDTNAVLERRVVERTAELQSAITNLRRANQVKDEFMAMISHELRTPLTGVLTLAELLADEIGGPLTARQSAYVNGITESGERLLAVVNGILSYTHLLAGKVRLEVQPCDLTYLLDTCATSQRHKAAEKQQSISVDVAPPDLAITTDPTALAEVLKRLLDNAIKFTPDGGEIGLEAHPGGTPGAGPEPGTVDLVVWDTGIGIAADQHANIFQAFTQADARLARSHEGIGLGLAYVYEMVHLMGGTMALESMPGEGSRFTISLPAQLRR